MSSAAESLPEDGAIDRLLATALEEDLGAGDVTSRAVLPDGLRATATVRAKESLVVAGLDLVPRLYARLGDVRVDSRVRDGTAVEAGASVQVLRGSASAILTGERTALNLLQHLSGIATLTRRCVERLAGTRCVLRDTRKTLPGLRAVEKYAVRVGGGSNHRMRLDDGVLIKDNHIDLAGGVAAAVRLARRAETGLPIEVECRTLEDVTPALEAGADMLLLDNMPLDAIRAAVSLVGGRVPVEASGGLTPERIREVAELGVDFVALGCLTHSARAVDLSMSVEADGG